MGEWLSWIGDHINIVGPVIGATMVVVQLSFNSFQYRKTGHQQIYQALELASINLFRFECEHPELVAELWFESGPLTRQKEGVSNLVLRYQLKAYICQILNLFEMACRFRKDKIFEPEIFGSWAIWMWELCCEPVFQREWKDGELKWNYVSSFRVIIDDGIEISQKPGEYADKRRQFFRKIADSIGDNKNLAEWFEEKPKPFQALQV